MSRENDLYRRITELIAELHALYHAGSANDEVIQRLESAHEALRLGPQVNQAGRRQGNQVTPGLVTTGGKRPLREHLAQHTRESTVVRIATAFLSAAEHNPLNLPLDDVTRSGGRAYILTSLMNAFNRPETLRSFTNRENIELRLYVADPEAGTRELTNQLVGFHAKTYLFEKASSPNVVVTGSANMTRGGLGSNVEWSYMSDFEVNARLSNDDGTPYAKAAALFDETWNTHGLEPDPAFLSAYEQLYREAEAFRARLPTAHRKWIPIPDSIGRDEPEKQGETKIVPRPAQQTALTKLEEFRRAGHTRLAVIAATGVGKTFLSAFDVRNARVNGKPADRVLFIAHRELILKRAQESFGRVIPDLPGTIIQGAESISESRGQRFCAFATVQTLSRSENLKKFSPDEFDYIVVDEFHHAAAESYQAILDYFRPTYLLGMTATPERVDGQDVLEICDRNVAYEVRLFEAIDRRWLVPFQYYAIYDPTDYSQIRWTGRGYDELQLERALEDDSRAEIITTNLGRFQPASGGWKCLAFCSNKGHAQWMARVFTEKGYPAESIIAETSDSERAEILRRLQSDEDELKVVCSVDVLSEGVDIPALTHILLLRPTQSFQVFLQQLGRGLRLHPGKEFVVVLDFVGNFENNYVAPLVLGGRYAVPETKHTAINSLDDFELPAGCHIGVDTKVRAVWREQIEKAVSPKRRIDRIRQIIIDAAHERATQDVEAGTGKTVTKIGESDVAPGDVKLVDLFNTESVDSVQKLVRDLGGWLQIRAHPEVALISDYEQQLVGTVGEQFLKHIEQELHPTKSYKMAILHSLLDMADEGTVETEWSIDPIAKRFLQYYLANPRRIKDWPALAKSSDPTEFGLSKVRTHIISNPLNFLSNTEEKFFELDKAANAFRLKKSMHDLWRDRRFRDLVRERVDYAEACYWYGRPPSGASQQPEPDREEST